MSPDLSLFSAKLYSYAKFPTLQTVTVNLSHVNSNAGKIVAVDL